MHSAALSTIVALPADQASRRLREYTYRGIIGRGGGPVGTVTFHPSDDVTESVDVEFRIVDEDHTRVVLTLESRTDKLAVARRYQQFLEGFRIFAEGETPVSRETRARRAA
jgi:hypothetical protein